MNRYSGNFGERKRKFAENGFLVDIIETSEYQQIELELQKEKKKQELSFEIEQLDKKRIRAICEPSLKNGEQTWLEYYTSQIQVKRQEITIL